jgi:hypothetical protein
MFGNWCHHERRSGTKLLVTLLPRGWMLKRYEAADLGVAMVLSTIGFVNIDLYTCKVMAILIEAIWCRGCGLGRTGRPQ